jgi:hypothetical protein
MDEALNLIVWEFSAQHTNFLLDHVAGRMAQIAQDFEFFHATKAKKAAAPIQGASTAPTAASNAAASSLLNEHIGASISFSADEQTLISKMVCFCSQHSSVWD